MKKLFMLVCLMFIAYTSTVCAINTNTAVTINNIQNEISDGTVIIGDWKEEIKAIKTNGFSIAALISLVGLIFLSVTFIGVILVILLNIIEFVTPPEIDKKLDKAEAWITDNLIKLPVKLTAMLRGGIVKK